MLKTNKNTYETKTLLSKKEKVNEQTKNTSKKKLQVQDNSGNL